MKDHLLVNMGDGTVCLCKPLAVLNGDQLRELREGINSLLDPPATDTRESRTPDEDSSSTSPDPADSHLEDEPNEGS